MINLCTVSDCNYLIQGMALYESLKEHTSDFILHYLCIDKKSFNLLEKYKSNSLVVHDVKELVQNDSKLEGLSKSEYKYFCWSLASYFTNHLMHKDIGDVTYIDSDIFFYHSFEKILDAIGEKEVGIFRHRQFSLQSDHPSGLFNVGVVHFKDRSVGKQALDWWSDAVLNKKYPHLGQCGDQKYLDKFLELPEDKIFIDGDIGHGAPWQWQLYDFSEHENDGSIMWRGNKQKLIFTHFSQFSYNIKEDSYIPSTMHHIYTPLNHYKEIPSLKLIYDNYFHTIKNTTAKYT